MKFSEPLQYTILHGIDALKSQPISKFVAIDTELFGMDSTKLHYPTGTFASMSIATDLNTVVLITKEEEISEALQYVSTFGEEKHFSPYWVLQNAVFDFRQLRRWVPELFNAHVWDTMVVEQGLFGGYYRNFSLDAMSARWLNYYMDKSIRDSFAEGITMTDEMLRYSAEDAIITLRIAFEQFKYIKENNLMDVLTRYVEVDEPMSWAVLDMDGILVDKKGWLELAEKNRRESKAAEEELGVNVYSFPKVRGIISDYTGINVDKVESDAVGLSNYIARYGADSKVGTFCQRVIDIRSIRKLSSSYGEKWVEEHVNPKDGKVYANWKISEAVTGRMACDTPNLQNIPSSNDYRTKFYAGEGEVLMVADVSQQEPRITAYLSQDENMLNIFREGKDFHSAVAVLALHSDPDTITHSHPDRVLAKKIGLGLAYNLSVPGLADKLGVNEAEAQKITDDYFKAFPRIVNLKEESTRMAARGYVTTVLGKRCYISPYSHNVTGMAVNYRVQGTAAEQTKLACNILWRLAKENNKPYPVVLVVHDETVLRCKEDEVDMYRKWLHMAWEYAGNMTIPGVPIVLEIGVGPNWSAKE